MLVLLEEAVVLGLVEGVGEGRTETEEEELLDSVGAGEIEQEGEELPDAVGEG